MTSPKIQRISQGTDNGPFLAVFCTIYHGKVQNYPGKIGKSLWKYTEFSIYVFVGEKNVRNSLTNTNRRYIMLPVIDSKKIRIR